MFNFLNKQYVFKQSTGTIWNIYYDEYAGLCYCSLTKRNTWTDTISIQKNILPFFHANMDSEDHFHILFQDLKGNIFYTKLDNNINTIPILSGKLPSPQNKHLFLLPFKNIIYLFYVLPYNNSYILAQQVIQDNKVNSPVVVDYVVNNNRPFSILSDSNENIYVFYQATDGKYSQVGYKKLLLNSRKWSDFNIISRYEGNCEFISALVDSKDVLHICYQRFNNKQFELVYQQKISDRTIWTNDVIIQTSQQSFENSFILYLGNSLTIYWTREDAIFHSTSTDSGNSWTKTQRYNFLSVKQLHCLSYRTNSPNENGRIAGDIFPGSFINGLKLAFYQDNSNTVLSAEDLKNLIIDGLRLLKGNVEELKESNIINKDDITRLNGTLQNFEKDLVKYSLKLNMMENELNQFRIIVGKLEKYKNILEKLSEENKQE